MLRLNRAVTSASVVSTAPASNRAHYAPDILFPASRDSPGMNRLVVAGVSLVALGVVGYGAGVLVAFPGRSFSVTAVMVGITLVAIRSADAGVSG